RALVSKWVSWFKEYRDILESDLIHVRRPDGQDLDCYLHVNPLLVHRALVVVFNPRDQAVERNLVLPLYYSGLTDATAVRDQKGQLQRLPVDRQYRVRLPVRVPGRGAAWYVFEQPS